MVIGSSYYKVALVSLVSRVKIAALKKMVFISTINVIGSRHFETDVKISFLFPVFFLLHITFPQTFEFTILYPITVTTTTQYSTPFCSQLETYKMNKSNRVQNADLNFKVVIRNGAIYRYFIVCDILFSFNVISTEGCDSIILHVEKSVHKVEIFFFLERRVTYQEEKLFINFTC